MGKVQKQKGTWLFKNRIFHDATKLFLSILTSSLQLQTYEQPSCKKMVRLYAKRWKWKSCEIYSVGSGQEMAVMVYCRSVTKLMLQTIIQVYFCYLIPASVSKNRHQIANIKFFPDLSRSHFLATTCISQLFHPGLLYIGPCGGIVFFVYILLPGARQHSRIYCNIYQDDHP